MSATSEVLTTTNQMLASLLRRSQWWPAVPRPSSGVARRQTGHAAEAATRPAPVHRAAPKTIFGSEDGHTEELRGGLLASVDDDDRDAETLETQLRRGVPRPEEAQDDDFIAILKGGFRSLAESFAEHEPAWRSRPRGPLSTTTSCCQSRS